MQITAQSQARLCKVHTNAPFPFSETALVWICLLTDGNLKPVSYGFPFRDDSDAEPLSTQWVGPILFCLRCPEQSHAHVC